MITIQFIEERDDDSEINSGQQNVTRRWVHFPISPLIGSQEKLSGGN